MASNLAVRTLSARLAPPTHVRKAVLRSAAELCLSVLCAACLPAAADAAILSQQLLIAHDTISGGGSFIQGAVELSLFETSHRETNSNVGSESSTVLGYFALFEPSLGTLTGVSLYGAFPYLQTVQSDAHIVGKAGNPYAGLSVDSAASGGLELQMTLPDGFHTIKNLPPVLIPVFSHAVVGPDNKEVGNLQRNADLSTDLSGISQGFVKTPGGVAVGSLDLTFLAPYVTQTWQCDTNPLGLPADCIAQTRFFTSIQSFDVLTLQYDYIPMAVPEAGSAASIALGLAALVLVNRRCSGPRRSV